MRAQKVAGETNCSNGHLQIAFPIECVELAGEVYHSM